LEFLANPGNRKKLTGELAHFRWFDPSFVTPVPWKVDPSITLGEKHLQGVDHVYRLLKSRGASETCWAISQDPEIDGRELDLKTILEKLIGSGTGTLLSCLPGKLAYFDGEDERLLLARYVSQYPMIPIRNAA
jgi:hypothetical protein